MRFAQAASRHKYMGNHDNWGLLSGRLLGGNESAARSA